MLPTRVLARGGLEKLTRGPGSEIRLDVGLEKLRGLYEAYRSFLQRAGHCISKKPLNKDYLYEGVSQLYLNKPDNA